jgi:hypothetical protein
MNTEQRRWLRLGLLTQLVESSTSSLGRTALMKLAYLLQTLKEVPLGYDFRLYTYGPYQSDLLNDLGRLETMRAVASEVVQYPSGTGYVFTTGPESGKIKSFAGDELSRFQDSVSWVLSEFGTRSASDLELVSTIVFADRESLEDHRRISRSELCRQVREIKPRFSEEVVNQFITNLMAKGLLCSLEEKGSYGCSP